MILMMAGCWISIVLAADNAEGCIIYISHDVP